MLKKTITYTDYNGNEQTHDYYFNLNKVECTQLQMNKKGGFDKYIKDIVDQGDTNAIFDVFNKIILKAYGVKDPEGQRFIKSDKLSEEFSQTPAYEVLFMEIATNPQEAENFIKGVFPQEMIQALPNK